MALSEDRILAEYGFNANISFTFEAVKNLHVTYLCSGLLCKFFGDFWMYLEVERLFIEIINFEDLVLF